MEAILKYLEFIPSYAIDVVDLISSPKRFLNSRNVSSNESWHMALRFFALSILFSSLLQHFSVWHIEYKDANFLLTLANSAATGIAGVLLGTTAIKLAWKFVGGRAPFGSMFLTFVYIYSVFTLWISCTSLAFIGVIASMAPVFYAELIKIFSKGGSAAFIIHFFLSDHNLYKSPNDIFVGLSVVIAGSITIIVALMWIIATWGAYRTLNNVSRARSCAAFVISGFLYVPVYGITTLIDAGVLINP
jgi:hypothetical protein